MSDWSAFAVPHHAYEVDPARVRALKRALEKARQYGGFKSLDALAERWLPVGEDDADWFQDPDYSYRVHALLEHCRVNNEDIGAGDSPLLRFEEEKPNLVPTGPCWHTWKDFDLEGAVSVFTGPARGLKPPTVVVGALTATVEAALRQSGDELAKEHAVTRIRDWKTAANTARDAYARRLKLLGRKKAWILSWSESGSEKTVRR
jgi:hypothetical protein